MRNIILLLVLSLALASPASAQQRRLARVSATIALGDDAVLAGAPYRILRRVDVSPHDVVLLGSGADAAVLTDAIAELQTLRRLQGDTAQASGMMRVRRGANARGRRMLPWAPRVLQDLRRAGAAPVPGVGTVPSVQVWLPATHKARLRT